jgi:polar amino acid transport system permease protein
MDLDFTWQLLTQILPYGVWLTVEISVICFVLGNAMAVGVAVLRMSKNPIVANLARGYISLFRSTPFLTQVYIIYYGLGDVFSHQSELRHSFLWPFLREAFWYGIVALSLNTAAYTGNILKGGLEAVPFGEIEAGRAFGMSRFLIFWRISLPRALRIILPTMSGETILLVKTTAILSTITILDLMGTARFWISQTFRVYEPLLAAALYYVILTFIITRVFRYLESYLNKDRREPLQIDAELPVEVA